MQITITKSADGTYRRTVPAQLIYQGIPVEQIAPAYCPEHIGRLSKDQVEAVYMSNKRYNQALSEIRKDQIWNQILENRKALSSIVLSTRHLTDNKIVRPLPQQVSMFTRSCNSINKLVNCMFEKLYSQPQIAM